MLGRGVCSISNLFFVCFSFINRQKINVYRTKVKQTYLFDPHGKSVVQDGKDSLLRDQYKPLHKIDVHIFAPSCLPSP